MINDLKALSASSKYTEAQPEKMKQSSQSPSQSQSSQSPIRKKSSSSGGLSRSALIYMSLLALQFGFQPMLTKRFTPPTVCRSSVVIVQESIKFLLALLLLLLSGQCKQALSQWTWASWIQVAVLPAALYCVQNIAALYAYQNLDAITFNVLNQTKTLSAALCCFLIMGYRQSFIQILSLFILLIAALVLENIIPLHSTMVAVSSSSSSSSSTAAASSTTLDSIPNQIQFLSSHHFTHGVAPILLASFLSGLNGAITQKSLQQSHSPTTTTTSATSKQQHQVIQGGRNSYLFSMELCVASVLILVASLSVSEDGIIISQKGFFHHWTLQTFIPILTNALGGIIVGLVTKHAGSVQKGFALIFGILISGILQQVLEKEDKNTISLNQVVSGILAAVSLWMHAAYPHHPSSSTTIAVESGKTHSSSSSSSSPSPSRRKSRKED